MRTLLGNSELEKQYTLLEAESLSFKDKLSHYYGFDLDTLNDFHHELKLSGSASEQFCTYLTNFGRQAKILLVSDYDCDGLTSLAIIVRLLKHLGINFNYYIPSRTKEGYGINKTIVELAHKFAYKAIITLDNGISAGEEIALAQSYGLDFLIIDHHNYTLLPKVSALIHPSLLDDYHAAMATAGLCYTLALNFYHDNYSLMLSAVGTLADMVPLFKANRCLLINGLKALNQSANTFKHLADDKALLTYQDLSFSVIPKLNALARLDNLANINKLVTYLFEADNHDIPLLHKINELNKIRKAAANQAAAKALKKIAAAPKQAIILTSDRDYQEGLCGLIANRLLTQFKKPVIVLNEKDAFYKGSARSLPGFKIYDFLRAFPGEYLSFGGHAQACGLALTQQEIAAFREYCRRGTVTETYKEKLIVLDMAEVEAANVEMLMALKPFGEGFKEPLFLVKGFKLEKKVLLKNLYPKYFLTKNITALSFNKALDCAAPQAFIGRLEFDDFAGQHNINLRIVEIVV